jgi:NDP-sugar pyrophosphorylase family protein
LNDLVLRQDFERITRGKTSSPISDGNRLIGNQIFAEEGVKVEAAIINSTYGPVYLSKESEIMEGAIIRGGLALGEGSSIKMGQNSMAPIPLIPIVKSVEK